MTMSVIRPSNIIKIYCFIYIFIMPFFIVMLVMDNLGRDRSYIEALIRWFLTVFIFFIFHTDADMEWEMGICRYEI